MKRIFLYIYFIVRLPVILFIKVLCKSNRHVGESELKDFLIIRIDRLGDFVVSIPVIENIKLKYPHARVSVLVRSYVADLARMIPSIDEVLVFEGMISTIKNVRQKRFDVVIDLICDYALRSACIAYMSGALVRVGFAGGYRELLFTHGVRAQGGKSIGELNQELLKAININTHVVIPVIPRDQGVVQEQGLIVIHPGGYYASQRWSVEKFCRLVKKIVQECGGRVIVVGSEYEKNSIETIAACAYDDRVQARVTTLRQLVSVLSSAELFVGNNSGPLHLAAALGIPTVSTMGPTDPILWMPKGKNHIVLSKKLSCQPCSKATCTSHICLDGITVEDMFKAVCSQLGKHV